MTAALADERFAGLRGPLEAFLATAAGASAAEITRAAPLTGGAIQENWHLSVTFTGGSMEGEQDLVLRTDSPSGVAVSLSRAQEFALLTTAASAGVTVPTPLWLCEDTTLLGRPFYLMRRVAGTAAGHLLVKEGSDAGDKPALAERLGEEMARIHAIRPPRPDLDFLGAPVDDPALALVERCRAHLSARDRARPALEWALRWCERHAPAPAPPVLVHLDFRTGNYMVDRGALTGVLDWEFADWGDAMSDLGWFCAKCWRFGRPDLEAGGLAERAALYRGYERVAGHPVDHERVLYWEVVAHARWAVIALQQGDRFLTDGEASLELALTGRVRPVELELELLRMTAPRRWSAA